MKLKIFNTHMELSPYVQGQVPSIEELYSAFNYYSQQMYPCGYLIKDDILYLPRGSPINEIKLWTDCNIEYVIESDPIDQMSQEYRALYEPRNQLQIDSINFLASNFNHQLALNLLMGIGKSYVTAAVITNMGTKALIVTHSEGLKQQWIIKTFYDMFTYKKKDLLNIMGSNHMDMILDGTLKSADINFVNHQTLRSFLATRGSTALCNFFKKLGIGIKVYDESHLEFANILLMDNFSNTDKTIYLTATFDRSDKSESMCYKQAFSSVSTFGEIESRMQMVKHIEYYVVKIDSHPNTTNLKKIWKYGRVTAASYGKYAFINDSKKTTYKTIKTIIEKLKSVEGKILVFVPLIAAVDLITNCIKEDFPNYTVGRYHSQVDLSEKQSTLKGDIIVSTIKSCGTGRDIPGLRAIICAEPIASSVQTRQLLGRLRIYGENKNTYFFDIVDTSIGPLNYWFQARFKQVKLMVKSVTFLNI